MHGVAEVRDDESLQRARRLALEEEREPDDDRHGEGRKPPERDHDQVRDREQEAEDHRHARTLEIVGDDDLNRKAARRVAWFGYFGHRPSVAVVAVGRGGSFVYDRAMPEPSVTPDDVRRAADAIRGRGAPDADVHARGASGPGRYLKAELFQRTGSFKARGALNRVRALSPAERDAGVISVSAGNHAQALAWAAATEDIDALLVMWQGASAAKIDATRGYGAAVDLEAPGPGAAFERLHELREQTGRTFVHPFDDPVVIAGAGTVGLEILEDVPGVDTIVVACGGGGLVSGIAAACVPAGVRVVAVEPEHSNALALGLAAGEPVPVTPETIADALTAPFTGRRPDRDLRSARGRRRPRLRGRDPGGIPLSLQPCQARRRARRRRRDRGRAGREGGGRTARLRRLRRQRQHRYRLCYSGSHHED